MRDHREGADPTPVNITELVEQHHRRHPGSVRRTPKAAARAKGKRQRASRRKNR